MYLQKLYEKYCKEESGKNGTALLTVEAFQELIEPRLARCKKVEINDGENGEGVLYYCLWEEDGLQFCATPVFGYYASSEKALSKLFMQLADAVMKEGDTLFQVNLYAHDLVAQRLFAMMQFGYMSEKGVCKIEGPSADKECPYQMKTLEKAEIQKNWKEIWGMTEAIVQHLKEAPVFYPGEEFTEEVYQEFFMDADTELHVAFDRQNRMIGMVETNQEPDEMIGTQVKSVNIGEIYVLPEYRGSALAKELLKYASEYERKRGANYLWVEHGTANPNARGFWNKYFETYAYELVRKIEK